MTLREKIVHGKETVVGGWSLSGDPAILEAMSSNFDFVVIDCEHGPASLRDVENGIRAIECGGSVPFVRIDRPERIGAYLDAGAIGIIAPNVVTPVGASDVVRRAKFPPNGSRSYSLARCTQYGRDAAGYYERANRETIVVCMIEHVHAIASLADIANNPGVDALLVGRYDLSGSCGYPGEFGHEYYLSAMERITEACQADGIPYGVHVPKADREMLTKLRLSGMRFVCIGMDTTTLQDASAALTWERLTR